MAEVSLFTAEATSRELTDGGRDPLPLLRVRQPLRIPAALGAALDQFAQSHGATLEHALLAAHLVLLLRHSGQHDLRFAVLLPGADAPDAAAPGRAPVDTAVARTELSGGLSFRAALDRISEARRAARPADARSDLAGERAWTDGEPEEAALRQVGFAFRRASDPDRRGDISAALLGAAPAELDPCLELEGDARRDLEGALLYAPDRTKPEAAARLAAHLIELLRGALERPERRIDALPLLTAAEQERTLVAWNATEVPYPSGRCVHHLFEEQAERTPEAPAVEGVARLSYREINQRANRLAHRLIRMGVGPEVRVGICVTRSPDMVIGLLGILKAGAAYVALDPTHPAERLGFLVKDAAPRVLLTQRSLLDLLPREEAQVFCLDAEPDTVGSEPGGNPATPVTGQDLAYLLYTSGSTGEPKGVMIEHRSVVNYLSWLNAQPDLVHPLPVVTSITFDAFLKQVFAPLIRGDAVWLVADDHVAQPEALLDALASRESAGLNCVPSLWQTLLSTGRVARLGRGLRSLLLGGEQLSPELLSATWQVLPDVAIWNLYGPTEATANASTIRLSPGEEVTVGRPLANVQLYILGDGLEPTPIGVVGELYIGGDGLGRGYWSRPALTARRFVPSPFGAGGERLYRTGDRARYREDGRIELLGRTDHQIKIRGFRVELGEIEATIRKHPEVLDAVVQALGESAGDRRLIGYVIPRPGAAVDAGELRRFLRSRLPDHMVPWTFVEMQAFPLTPNGKLDRRALPQPEEPAPAPVPVGAPEAGAAPRGAADVVLSVISHVLRVERVSLEDNFYDLGGHSLAAMQVVARLREALKAELPLIALYEAPTLAELVSQVEALREERGP